MARLQLALIERRFRWPSWLGGLGLAAALALAPGSALAATAPFDLIGPQLTVTVTRAGKTLPIAQTPNLAEGDVIVIKTELPANQSVHYILVAGFLRGVTNPPPAAWFSQARTWRPEDKDGLKISVPVGAQQMLVFLAPETGGDFKTLVSAVRGRPGAFVRASQDLNQASLDHARLQAFLSAVQTLDHTDAGRLKTASPLLARSLAIKLDSACLDKTTDAQASCLTQGRDSLVLDDGHSTSMVEALSSGYSAELIQQLSAAPQVGGGYFSPYVASVLDIAHILDSFHTAQYQYIPALGSADGSQLSLLLNAPPSFQNPKSVLVAALPAVEPALPPPLHVIDPDAAACLEKPGLVLQAEGAPLVFSTDYAHDLLLSLKAKDGKTVTLPVKADAMNGGLDVDASGLDPGVLDGAEDAHLQGQWGFDAYDGPTFHLQNAQPQTWRLAPDDQQFLTAGRDSTIHLQAQAVGCVQEVTLQAGPGPAAPTTWKASGGDSLTVTAALEDAPSGPANLIVTSYGGSTPDIAPVTIYAAPSRLESFAFHAGDGFGVLHGADLQNVAAFEMGGVSFKPDPSHYEDAGLTLTAVDAAATTRFKPGQRVRASAKLADGRTVNLTAVVGLARPAIALIGKSVQAAPSTGPVKVDLKGADELPHNAQMTFSIQAQGSTVFTGAETIEVQTNQGDFTARLTSASGGFILQNAQVALATLDLETAFGVSAFGPLRFRLVNGAGPSDWTPLGVLVRLPNIHDLACAAAERSCQLTGSNLFLIESVSNTPDFDDAVHVPNGFPGNALQVPQPTKRQLFVKLSDDPSVINVMTFSRRERAAAKTADPSPDHGKPPSAQP